VLLLAALVTVLKAVGYEVKQNRIFVPSATASSSSDHNDKTKAKHPKIKQNVAPLKTRKKRITSRIYIKRSNQTTKDKDAIFETR